MPYKIVATFPAHTFLEHLAIAHDGTLFITNHEVGEVIWLTAHGEPTVFACTEGKVTGITFAPNGDLIFTGWNGEGASVILSVAPG